MIAISGKERSGTTWLEYLLKENYYTCGIDAKDKHNFTGKKRSTDIETVVISKNPWEWWVSYYNYVSPNVNLNDFSVDYFDTWNNFYYCWILWAGKAPVKFIRYDDLYENPEGVLNKLNIKRNEFEFDRVENVVCADGTKKDCRFVKEKRIYVYGNNPELKEKLIYKMDLSILDFLGYEWEG